MRARTCGERFSVLAVAAGAVVVFGAFSSGSVRAQGAANLAGHAVSAEPMSGGSSLAGTGNVAGGAPGAVGGSGQVALSGQPRPVGVWVDHTGRGAVEISECGKGLCGRIVWVNDPVNSKACGLEILGDVQEVGPRRWDNGWILDPDYGHKFDVELTPLEDGRLQVLGYAGIKALSETMIWNKAPETLVRCDAGSDVSLAGSAAR